MAQIIPFLFIITAEAAVLYAGQRRLFGLLMAGKVPRLVVYLWALGGTVLHELAHFLMCVILRVPVGRVELFRPRRMPDGGVTLGQVEHGVVDPVRMTLVAIAPALLVPPLLILLGRMMLGEGVIEDPVTAFINASWGMKLLAVYLLVSAGGAAFPSPGDHIPLVGLILLVCLVVLVFISLSPATTVEVLRLVAIIGSPSALAAGLQLAVLSGR